MATTTPYAPGGQAMHDLTLGQVRDVCLQIRAWLDADELERAVFWSRRLRGERPMCSVDGCLAAPLPDRPWCRAHRPRFLADSVLDCASQPLPDRPWCDEHRIVRLREPERRRRPTPEERMRDILDLIRRHPGISDSEIGRRIGLGAWMVGRYRQKAGIPVWWRRVERPFARRNRA